MTKHLILASALALAACSSQSELTLTLKLSDSVYPATETARITISGTDQTAFPASTEPVSIATGLYVVNRDADGDGRIDIVVELTKDFHFAKDVQFTIEPRGLTAPVDVAIRAETFDARGNRVARIGGAARVLTGDHVSAQLAPRGSASAPALEPTCVGTCPQATAAYGPSDVGQTLDLAKAAPTALVAAAFDQAGRSELAIGAGDAITPATAIDAAQPRAGRIELWTSTGGVLQKQLSITGDNAGDRLGAALAGADLDGDGIDDLVVGAPGEQGNRGVLRVLYGPLSSISSLTSSSIGSATGAASALLGSSIAVEDLDGDGTLEILVGASGTDDVYVLHASDLPRGKSSLSLPAASIASVHGNDGTQFGSALSTREGKIAVAAPLETGGGAWLVPSPGLLDGASHMAVALGSTRWRGSGGGFGTSVLLADTDGAGTLSLFVGSELDGTGRISSRPTAGLTAGDADSTSGVTSLRGGIDDGQLGASLTAARSGLGDRLLFGAAGSTMSAGAAYVLSSATPSVSPELALSTDGTPAGIVVTGGSTGDGFGSISVAGDFNQDGALDLAIGAASGSVSIVTGPIL